MKDPATPEALLQSCFLFRGIPPEEAAAFAAQSRRVRFEAGQVIYSAGRFRRAIGVLLSGAAQVTNAAGVPLNTLAPGSCFGVAALFHPVDHYVSTVTALAPTEIAFFTGGQLEALFAQQPQVARNYITFLSERIQFLNEKIGSFTAPSALARVARYLEQKGPCITVKSYTRLADELNLGRASLYRALDALADRGILCRRGPQIRVLDQGALGQIH